MSNDDSPEPVTPPNDLPRATPDVQPESIESNQIETAARQAAKLRRYARQQASVAALGQHALAGTEIEILREEAVVLIAQTLAVEYVKMFELLPDQDLLLLRAGLGWRAGLVGHLTLPANSTAEEAGYTLLLGEPIIVEDFAQENRFKPSPLLREHQIVSGMNVVMHSHGRPFGVLGVAARQRQSFTEDDLYFLQSVANILALTMARRRTELEINQRNRELLTLQSAGAAVTSSLDLDEVLQTVARSICRWLNIAGCAISEWQPAEEKIITMVDYGPPSWDDLEPPGLVYTLADYDFAKTVLLEKQPLQLHRSQPDLDSLALAYMQRIDVTTLLMLPMIFQDRVVGMVEIFDDWATRAFTAQEIALGQLLANQAASAIENARLYQRAQQEIAERKRVEAELQQYKTRLEEQVAARTVQLTLTNEKLLAEVTERKRAEEELRQAKDVAEAANRAKSQFLANMSHELRTPLNNVLGYAQILKQDRGLSAEQSEAVEIMQQSSEHLLTLLNDLLDLSKIEAGRMELFLTEIHLIQFLKNIVDMFRIPIAQKGLELILEIDPLLPDRVQADEKRLRQVLINLLGNAVKFTKQGQVVLQVIRRADKIRFQVEDTGVGIAAADLNHIFSPFRQGGTLSNKVEGTGLGLAISHRLVAVMGGALQVDSQAHTGSNFWFELAMLPAKEPKSASEIEQMTIGGHKDAVSQVLAGDVPQGGPTLIKATSESGRVGAENRPPLIGPPPREAAHLFDLARKGDVKQLKAEADQLLQLGEQYQPFVKELRRLLKQYQIKQIQTLLQPYL